MTTFHDLAKGQRGYLDRAQVHGVGMSDEETERLVEQNHWQRPHPGVYRTGSAPPEWEDKVRAACMAAGGDARAMGRTAARIRDLDGSGRHTIIELTVSVGRGPTPAGVITHVTRRSNLLLTTAINGIPVSSINQTLVEYAWLTRSDQLVERALEDAFRRGMTDEGPLRRFLSGCGKGVPGVTRLRRVLDGRPHGRPARSGFEVIVLDVLREYGLPLPLRRPLVAVPPDRKFELDLAYLDRLIDIEPMGEKWHATAQQRRADAERRTVLGARGWQVVPVFWDEAVHAPWSLADRVRQALALAGP